MSSHETSLFFGQVPALCQVALETSSALLGSAQIYIFDGSGSSRNSADFFLSFFIPNGSIFEAFKMTFVLGF